ncbi:cyclin-domain-containing protein [Mycena olivaceomarginata]|nr:cyclin-domain-containing protein [Mycena olivaceomarginata]
MCVQGANNIFERTLDMVEMLAPFDLHSCPSPDFLHYLAAFLTHRVAENDRLHSDPPIAPQSTVLVPTSAPEADILRLRPLPSLQSRDAPLYIRRGLSPAHPRVLCHPNEVFLSLLVYSDRMSKLSAAATGRTLVIDSYTIHRLVIAGVTVASKFFSDVLYANSRWAKVGGLLQAELNELELQFMLLNDFRLVIPPDEMQLYVEELNHFAAVVLPRDG